MKDRSWVAVDSVGAGVHDVVLAEEYFALNKDRYKAMSVVAIVEKVFRDAIVTGKHPVTILVHVIVQILNRFRRKFARFSQVNLKKRSWVGCQRGGKKGRFQR